MTTLKKEEDDLKKRRTTLRNLEDNLKKIKNGRRPQKKIKNERRPKKIIWKTKSTKINLIGCDTIENSPTL